MEALLYHTITQPKYRDKIDKIIEEARIESLELTDKRVLQIIKPTK